MSDADHPRLVTDRLVLRGFEERDAPDIARHAGEYEMSVNFALPPFPYTPEDAHAWVKLSRELWAQKTGLSFALDSPADDSLIGSMGFKLALEHRRAEIGYWIARPHWGNGYATEAARRLVRYAFHDLNLNRVCACYYHWNRASGRVLEKCGLKHEGVQREHAMRLGRLADNVLMGVTRAEWEEARRRGEIA